MPSGPNRMIRAMKSFANLGRRPDPVTTPPVDLYEPPDPTPYIMPETQLHNTSTHHQSQTQRHNTSTHLHPQLLGSTSHRTAKPLSGHPTLASAGNGQAALRVANPGPSEGRSENRQTSRSTHPTQDHSTRDHSTQSYPTQTTLDPRDYRTVSNEKAAHSSSSRLAAPTNHQGRSESHISLASNQARPARPSPVNPSSNTGHDKTRTPGPRSTSARPREGNAAASSTNPPSSSRGHRNQPRDASASLHPPTAEDRGRNRRAHDAALSTARPISTGETLLPTYSQVGRDAPLRHNTAPMGIEQTLFTTPQMEIRTDVKLRTRYDLSCSQCLFIYKRKGSTWDLVGECPTHSWTRARPRGPTSIEGDRMGPSDYYYACNACGKISSRLLNGTFYETQCTSKKCRGEVRPLIFNPNNLPPDEKQYCCWNCRSQTNGPVQYECKELGQWKWQYMNWCRTCTNWVQIIPVEFKRDPVFICPYSECHLGYEAAQNGQVCPSCSAKYTEAEAIRQKCIIEQSTHT
ncbi:uncharacterized protein I303_105226 [Kwoniella dejecticola CBS 10117]|uniref:Uncharacterized protein n=1 Tax=Kwoniella dejecticola CBS 10117 TaxID=1296121 RepID=A0A1A6A335_9TREE|nr:uncharacterized protein I303_05327 [Kwoniella dejecticola CBS 10117]OBR84469.1 hypothetical protein I303_05327 [Kwoniella dejecticola CBS 10117]